MGGDLRFLSKDEIAKAYTPELASAAFELKSPGDKTGPVDTPAGVELVKLQVKTGALTRGFDESKEPIRQRMARERRSRDYDEWVKKLRESTKVTIHDQELEKVQADPPPQQGPTGQPGINVGHSMPQASPPTAPAQPGQSTTPTATSKIGGN
jgi:peptidyl-prolyl cis-trans isomerase C